MTIPAAPQSGSPFPAALLERTSAHVHMLGIGGVGMAGLACLLAARGFRVSGCDAAPSSLSAWLVARGIRVARGHEPAHVAADVDWLVRSTAVSPAAPEAQAAQAAGLPLWRRGEVLPALLARYPVSVAVSGTHGKTTTTGFIVQLLRAAGRDPAWCIGGEVPALGGVAGPGDGHTLVVEADESDGTLVHYHPDVAVITNIEFDHMEHFADVAAFEACFRAFLAQARRGVAYGADDPRAAALAREARLTRSLSYGFSPGADVRGEAREEDPSGQSFAVIVGGRALGRLQLPVLGLHHARNALAAVAAGLLLDLDPAVLLAGAARLQLARRRFECLAARHGITVISDYAHHPTEVAAVVGTARTLPHRRLLAVFQPHRHTRTRALGAEFPRAFAGLDRLVLVPVYAASEAPLPGGSVWDLYAHVREQAARAVLPGEPAIPVPAVALTLREAWLALERDLRPGDLLLVLGAGDVEQIAAWAATAVNTPDAVFPVPRLPADLPPLSPGCVVRADEPLATHTSLGVGGPADVWMELATEADLGAVLRWVDARGLPLSLLGGGYNTLASDLGVRGVTVRLTGADFRGIREEPGLVIAGAAVVLGDLLDWLQARAIGGFEFMEGIPGTLGGGMQMNAGAWGECLGDHLAWIRCLNRAGEVCIVRREGLDLGYRRCTFLRERYLIEAAFQVRPGDPAAIDARRREIRARRAWMAGYRSAGSFFKNPEGEKAGRLLENVGMHGSRVGGALIGTHHANFVITEGAATASDVLALTERGRAAVRERSGIELEAEVKVIGEGGVGGTP